MSLEVIKEASAAGVRLFLSNGQLKVMAEQGALTPQLKQRILAAKKEVMALLAEINTIGSQDETQIIKPALRKAGGLPLSFQQQRLWVLNEIQQGSSEYNIPMAFTVRGRFAPDTAEQAMRAIVSRHEVLRSNYFPADSSSPDSGALQRIRSDADFRLERMDLTHFNGEQKAAAVDAALLAQATKVFDLQRDFLLRAIWIQLEADTGVLGVNMHHIVSDEWSIEILMREFTTLYEAFCAGRSDPLLPLPIQYSDYAVWQRQHLEEKIKQQADYWRNQLADAPVVHSLPIDFPRPAQKSNRGAAYRRTLPPAVVDKLNALASRNGMTLFMLIHAALGVLIARHGDSKEATIGTSLANRLSWQLEPLIGFFVNQLALRIRVDEALSIDDYLRHVKEVNVAAQSNQDIPFDVMLEQLKIPRSMSHAPVFQITLSMHNMGRSAPAAQGPFTVEPRSIGAEFAQYDLTVHASADRNGLELNWTYDVSLFESATIERYSRYLNNILSALALAEVGRVRDLVMLSEEDRRQLVEELNDTRQQYDAATRVHEHVARQAALSPGKLAVTYGNESIGYRLLEKKASCVAHLLRKRGVKAGQRVGIAVIPSIDMVVALLAVMKVGGVYVPVDVDDARLQAIVKDSAMNCLLVDSGGAGRLTAFADLVVVIDTVLPRQVEDVPAVENLGPDSPVCILYTADSTGSLKGAAVTGRSLANYLSHARREYMKESLRGAVMSSPLTSAAAITTLLTPLICGKELVILSGPQAELAAKLSAYLFGPGDAWLFKLTPAQLEAVAVYLSEHERGDDPGHVIVVGGEPLYKKSVRAVRRAGLVRSVLINEYGQTETVAGCSTHTIHPSDELSGPGVAVPIGRPIQNVQAFVINHELPVVDLDADAPLWQEQSVENPDPRALALSSRHLAYLIYTSGSTGQPKGVMIEHRSIINRIAWQYSTFGITRDDSILQRTSMSFDASAWEIFMPLMIGGRSILLPQEAEKDPARIIRTIERQVTVAQFVPTLLRAVLAHSQEDIRLRCRYIFSGGEPLDKELAEKARAHTTTGLVNLYGPTEVTIDGTAWPVTPERIPDQVPIGRPLANMRIYILDEARQPVPVGVAGEIYIGGVGVARGYLNREALTAERFLDSPFVSGDRLYKTGDLGRFLADGTIEFLGRNDSQVKIRGFRIELAEIEARLGTCEGVRDAVVVARESTPGDKRLVAYYTTSTGAEIDVETLKSHLSQTLTSYMVPATYVHLAALPLTPNGKLDRKSLPAPQGSAQGRGEHEAQADTEEPTTPFGLSKVLANGEPVGEAAHALDSRLSSRIRQRARTLGLSTASIFHAAWAQLISRASGRPDPVFGTVLSPVADTLPMKVCLTDRSVEQCVRETHEQLVRLRQHGPVSAGASLFTAVLIYRDHREHPATDARSEFPLTLSVVDEAEGFALTARVAPSIGPDRINAMTVHVLEQVIEALESNPARSMSELGVLPEEERRRLLVEWNETQTSYPGGEGCLHEIFEAQAARHPEAIAVVFEDRQLSYAELNRRANRLAHHLRALGVKPDQLVALCMERSLEMVVGLLGILKAGAGYLPLDPAYPIERLSYMLRDSSAVLVLTHAAARGVVQAATRGLGRASLAPFGAIGELHIAGDAVAYGYVGNDELQARSLFSMEVAPGSTHRLYGTGDLVRYNSNGELEYLGRADEQIIMRGQRVEPGEIQARLCGHPQVKDAVVLLAAQGGASSLVVFVVPNGPVAAAEEESLLASMREWSKKHLAAHLQPAAYKLIQELPLTRAGKVDKRALLKHQLFVQTEGSYVPPRNDVERILCEVYAGLLDVEQLGVHDNFFALGGDSILSIQAVSRARKAGVGISASKIFTYQTVAELAQVAEVEREHARSSAEVAGDMPLLPIHSLFFSLDSVAVHHFNQSVLLKLPRAPSLSTLSQLVRALYLRHDALRLRFRSSDGQWQARFIPFDESLCEQSCVVETLPEADRIEERCQHYQRSLNLETGPLFRAVQFTIGSDQHRLFLVFHHAIVDGVSWRVLIADMEQAFKQSLAGRDIDLPGRGSSYKDWSVALQRYSRSDELLAELPYWLRQLQASAELAVDSKSHVPPRHADSKELVVQLSKDETRRLLGKCSQAYSMRTAELLIAAMAMGLSRWLQRDSVLIELEGHGREELFPDLDIGDTVGWFTTVYPLALSGGLQPVPEALVAVKEQVRAIPKNGIGYGVLRHLARDSQLVAAERGNAPQLIFNYLGQLDQAVESDSELSLAAENAGQQISPERSRSHKVGVNAMVLGGALRLVWDYSATEFNEGTIARAAHHVLGSLRETIEHCANVVQRVYTPSDFPGAGVSMEQLRDWRKQYSFEKLYRATPAQQGMLAASELERATYVNQVYRTVRGQVDKALLEQAWQSVVNRHDMLRTVFVSNDHGIHQLVLSDYDIELPLIDLRHYPASEREAVFERHRLEDENAGFPLNTAPAHRMALFQMGEDRFRILFTNHHAILDGWSMAIVFNGLFAAYRSGEPPRSASGHATPDYEKYVSWLYRQPVNEARQFWKRYLGDIGATALLRPASSLRLSAASYSERSALLSKDETDRLRDFASRHHATFSTVAQLAWSLVLSNYTGRRDVVFGAVVSGRPPEVAGVENMVGQFVNTIPVRIKLDDAPLPETLARIQMDLVESNKHAYLSLIDIKRQAEVRGDLDMFETIVDFKNYPDVIVGDADKSDLVMEAQSEHDRNSFPVTLMLGAYDKLAVHCCYRDDLLPPAFVNSMIDDLLYVLRVLPDADSLAAIRPPGFEKVVPLTRIEPPHDKDDEQISSERRERPPTELEDRLCRLLASVLGVDAVGIRDNFFDLGGDSMLALRLRGLAQKQGIPVTVAQIYRLQTVAMIAAGIEGNHDAPEARAESVGKQPLLPIQQQILVARSGHDLNKLRHFNMAALFNVPEAMSIDALRAAAKAILQRHDALRLEFAIEEGVWCGKYRDYDDRMLDVVCRCEQITEAEIESRCRAYHEGFDLSQAPLIRLVKFELPTQARLFLVAHHSVVDVLSSQVLVSDLRTAFKQYAETGVVVLGARPASYQQWGRYLNECAARGSFAGERDYWLRQMPAVAQEFDCERDLSAPATFGNLAHGMVRLAEEETASLLRECQSFYGASINELLIAALYRALRHWSGRSTHSLFVMSHGRHSAELDLSETVGWFTDMYPLALEEGGIEYVKEQYRAVPNHGIGYGVLRHLCNDSELNEREQRYSPQVVLNYSGQLDGMVREAGYLEFSTDKSGAIASDEHEMPYKLVFQGGVYSGCLGIGIEYNKRRFASADIRSLGEAFRAELLKMVEAANDAVAVTE